MERCWRCCTSTAVAMAPTVDAGSLTGASSATKTSPSNSFHNSPASRMAIRVLPTPPGPVSVTSRSICSRSVSNSSSSARPTSLVDSAGTCRITDRRVRNGRLKERRVLIEYTAFELADRRRRVEPYFFPA